MHPLRQLTCSDILSVTQPNDTHYQTPQIFQSLIITAWRSCSHIISFSCVRSVYAISHHLVLLFGGGVQTWKVQYHILTCCTSQMPSFIGVSLKSPVHKIIIENILILNFFPTETRTWSQKGPMWYLLRKWSYLPGHLLVQSHSHQ